MSSVQGKSRWGNFFQGAVAGLESRLDNILADENTIAARNEELARRRTGSPAQQDLLKRSDSQRRTKELSKTNQADTIPSTPPLQPITLDSTNDFFDPDEIFMPPVPKVSTPSREQQQEKVLGTFNTPGTVPEIQVNNIDGHPDAAALEETRDAEILKLTSRTLTPSDNGEFIISECASRASMDTVDQVLVTDGALTGLSSRNLMAEDLEADIAQLRAEREQVELEHQEEVQRHLERIDALQSKLQYISREAANNAHDAAFEVGKDSVEGKLAAKDEQIAKLIEEGQNLSKVEVAHAGTIRKLRVKIAEDGKAIADAKKTQAGIEKALFEETQKRQRSEASYKDAAAKIAQIARFKKEAELAQSTVLQKNVLIESLQRQIREAEVVKEQEVKQAVTKALEGERKVAQSLRDDLVAAQTEKQMMEEQGKEQIKVKDEEIAREQERGKTTEAGLRNEISILEGRLEVFRVRSEENSATSTGDAQAKLMRQIEVLQSQYALASENWQGIEATLQARVTALERERNELSKQEMEARKKARESGAASRRLQQRLEDSSSRCRILEQEAIEQQAQAERLQVRSQSLESKLQEAKAGFEKEKQNWSNALSARIAEEKVKWRQELAPMSPSTIQNDSPTTSKMRGLELPSVTGRRHHNRPVSGDKGFFDQVRPQSRRSSAMPPRSPEPSVFEFRRTPSFPSDPPLETPSIHTIDQDEMVETASSPQRTINDVISGSVSGSGPSVQLVERMSAAVRRLESEKAASKDELSRLTGQRDEARSEVVSLMREVGAKRDLEQRFQQLETKMTELSGRYQTTLEMLGEKSERVDELEADIADVKKIYRDLLDKTMR